MSGQSGLFILILLVTKGRCDQSDQATHAVVESCAGCRLVRLTQVWIGHSLQYLYGLLYRSQNGGSLSEYEYKR